VLNALGTTRYLHIAAHGIPDVDAPLFSRLCLAGGPLYTYDILERDLRSTELVTLSACESTMLRFDLMDNVHGLAAAFLRAGARAVIGAMWQVESEVALAFFCHLYTGLAQGHDRIETFRAAQLHARAHYPNYRDWGAFTYLGL
jgi:CHAT domain-containing protein